MARKQDPQGAFIKNSTGLGKGTLIFAQAKRNFSTMPEVRQHVDAGLFTCYSNRGLLWKVKCRDAELEWEV